MTTEKDIRDRFLECINEVINQGTTLTQIANTIGTSISYLSQLKTIPKPQIKARLLANFCFEYNYSPEFILTGRGVKVRLVQMSKEEKLIEIIGNLIDALLELKPKWTNVTKELINEAKKRKQ